jgi:uncharacterized protein
MKIQVGGLSEGIHEYEFEVAPEELNLGESFSGSVLVKASLDKSVHQIALQAAISSTGHFACDRCVREFDLPIKTSYRMFYVMEGSEEGAIDPTEMQVIPHGVSTINLSDDVRQTVVIGIPLKLLCTPDCRGLCPECGRDRNAQQCSCSSTIVDSRWEGLEQLRRNETRD